jgi:hypothetical protein
MTGEPPSTKSGFKPLSFGRWLRYDLVQNAHVIKGLVRWPVARLPVELKEKITFHFERAKLANRQT